MGRKDDKEERGEYVERQAQMRRLSDKRHAANKAELRLRAKREALSRLAAERNAWQDMIDWLRSAKEMVVYKRSGMRRDDKDIFLYLALCVVLLG
jgi:hypothetical protein